ncbi:MAG: hypothetical protein IJ054_02270 [Lachnospiraceae bacterium]|nr:hypothetical protein [Lachnospiraceae bacterium]MBQ9234025.1 hypothetical protein [Lachnospiraceae bacterium]
MHLKDKIRSKLSIIAAAAIFTGVLFNPVPTGAADNIDGLTEEGIIKEEQSEDFLTDDIDENNLSVYAADTSQAMWDVLDLVNQERAAAGLSALVMDKNLVNTANVRANEIVTKFAHTRPDGTDCWTAFTDEVFWRAVGENIAAGQYTAEEVMDDWMNSSGHRANILSSSFNCIGIACIYVPGSKYGYYWVQDFGYTNKPVKYNADSSQPLEAEGITISSGGKNGYTMSFDVNYSGNDSIQYAWYSSKDEGQTWTLIKNWTTDYEWLTWVPGEYGEYEVVAFARESSNTDNVVKSSTKVSYHPYIKDKCQMPYWGEGGGYLIGFESYDNPYQNYQYEMFVMDLSLYAAGSPTPWVHRTYPITLAAGATPSDGKTLWTIWQPQYGYYLTLFRLYDKDGNILDEVCYGFANAY